MTGAREREASLAHLHGVLAGLRSELDLGRTLEAVCQGVVDGLGFGVAVVNLVNPDGDYDVVAVAGSEQARAALLGQRGSAQDWALAFAACERVGGLLLDYHRPDGPGADPVVSTRVPTWVPDLPTGDGESAWHPLDMLLAPLTSGRSGPVGVLSVDLPRGGQRPGSHQLELLELYAAHAAAAIENAALHTELVRRDAERAAVLARLSALVAQAPVAIVELDTAGIVCEWNPEAERMFGWRRAEVVGRLNPSLDPTARRLRVEELLRGGEMTREEVRRRRSDGTVIDVSVSASLVTGPTGEPTGFVIVYADITERVALERSLRHAAQHDALTGLPNRGLFAQQLREQSAAGLPAAVLLVDLDGFKAVNDTCGHAVGDEVLIAVAARLRATARAADTVARIGGDEFVVLVRSDDDVAGLATRLVAVVAEQLPRPASSVRLGASIGIARLLPGADGELALRHADLAMYAAKAQGRGRYRVYGPELLDATR